MDSSIHSFIHSFIHPSIHSSIHSTLLNTFPFIVHRELSVRRHDVVYLLRDVDKHWYECEHHGRLGIVPKTYVQVVTSLEEARTAAIQRQGLATAKYTFKAQTAVELSMNKVRQGS